MFSARSRAIANETPRPTEVPTLPQEDVEDEEAVEETELSEGFDLLDPSALVEEAELFMRVSAPHDFDAIVIGGGPGGCAAALRTAELGMRVGLIESGKLGGAYLHHGCIASKTLLEAVNQKRRWRDLAELGLRVNADISIDREAIDARIQSTVAALQHDMTEKLADAGVKLIEGRARFIGQHILEIAKPDGTLQRLRAVHIIIATGSAPRRPPLPGSGLPGVLTVDEILNLKTIPRHLVVVGGGGVGVEFAYLYHELGARVTLVETAGYLLPREDHEVGQEMGRLLAAYGLQIETGARLISIEQAEGGLSLTLERATEQFTIGADYLLFAIGRQANIADLNLDEVGIANERERIMVDFHRETSVGGVYAIGDCVRNVGWVHQAVGEGLLVAELICGRMPAIEIHNVPTCYFAQPEVASIGTSERVAKRDGSHTRCVVYHYRDIGQAAVPGEHDGFVKLVIDDGNDKLLGCHIIGPRATEMIDAATVAINGGHTVQQLADMLFAHPTCSEALGAAARAACSGK